MLHAVTRAVSRNISRCELTFRSREPIDYARAVRQHEEYCRLLRRYGIELIRLEAMDDYPDCCFVEDTAVVVDEFAIVTNTGAASRRGESAAVQAALAKYRPLSAISLPATMDGGDVLRIGRSIFVGISRRTNREGFAALSQLLAPRGYQVTPAIVKGSLHLKTACSALDDETIIVNPAWIELDPFARFRMLHTPEDEPWAASSLRLGDAICLQAGNPRTAERVAMVNDHVEILDLSELNKAEGSLSCLSIIFENGARNKR